VTADPVSNSKGHLTGCHCRKSSCLKKYCECFTVSVCLPGTCTSCLCCLCFEERTFAAVPAYDIGSHCFSCHLSHILFPHFLTIIHSQGAVPCGERCRCLDCKNAPAIYGSDLKHRLSLSSALGAPGIDRSNPRKDS